MSLSSFVSAPGGRWFSCLLLSAAGLVTFPSLHAEEGELKKDGKALLNFESETDLAQIKTLSSTVTLVAEGVAEDVKSGAEDVKSK